MSTLYDLITADPDLQDYWPLDDGSGSTARDTQGTAGTVHGSPTWNPSGIPQVGGRGTIQLNGSGDYIESASTYAVATTGSIEVWYYPPDHTTLSTPGGLHLLAGFLGGDSDSGDTQIAVGIFTRYQSGHWDAILKLPIPSSGQNVETSQVASVHLTEGAWNHIAVTWNATTGTIYVNGTAAGTLLATDWFSDTGEFYEGAYSTAGFYVGGGYAGGGSTSTIYDTPGVFADAATYYNDELTSSEVSAHYAAGVASGSEINVTATTDILIGLSGSGIVSSGEARVTNLKVEVLLPASGRIYPMSGATDLRIGLTGSGHILPIVSGATDLRIGSVGSGHVLPVVTASTDLRIGSVGSESYLPVVTATTDILIGLKATDPFFVTAATGLNVGSSGSAPNMKNVSAATDLRVGHQTSTEIVSTYVFVSASTALRLGHAASVSATHSRLMTATTALRIGVSSAGKVGRSFITRAIASLWVGGRGTETRDAAVSATTALSIGGEARKGREIFVSAITGIFAANGGDEGVRALASGSSDMLIRLNAGAHVGGHDAATGFQIGHLATAEVGLPWRRTGLTLRPGGNLPHS